VYDIFQVEDAEFKILFPGNTDIAFIDEIQSRISQDQLSQIMNAIRARPIKKSDVIGIHGTIFYELERKKQYYPERIDSLARNPTGSKLRNTTIE